MFVFLVLIAARVHVHHHVLAPFFLAFLTLFLDLDHYLGLQTRASFHSIFFAVGIPLVLLGLAWVFEKKGVFYKQLGLLLLVAWGSHLVLDLPGSVGIHWLYPLSDHVLSLGSIGLYTTIQSGETVAVVSTLSIALLVALIIMIPVFFLERIFSVQETDGVSNKTAVIRATEELKKIFREP